MKNKAFKIVVALMALVMSISSIVTGCGGEEKKVATDGSTSMEKVIGILGESFSEAIKDVTFTYNPTGSGIKAAKDGTYDIGFFADFFAETRKSEKTTIELHGEGLPFNSLIAPSDEGAIS